MPGPISDSFDPEWGTSSAAEPIIDSIEELYERVSEVLGKTDPIYVKTLAGQKDELNTPIQATLTEWEWRIIRFSLERAKESI